MTGPRRRRWRLSGQKPSAHVGIKCTGAIDAPWVSVSPEDPAWTGRVLTDKDIEHYQKIVVALAEIIRIMAAEGTS